MDSIDIHLLNLIQKNFPITPEPFSNLAAQLGRPETEVLQRIVELKQQGVIRRIGGSFNSKKLGYTSTLCAMKVSENQLENAVEIINQYPQVTHNYLRQHPFNLWFTLIAENEAKTLQIIDQLKTKTGCSEFMNLPAVQVFKIDMNFLLREA